MARPSIETLNERFQSRDGSAQISDGLATHASRQPIVRSTRPQNERLIDSGFAQAEAAHIKMIMALATPPKASAAELLADEITVLAEAATEPEITRIHRAKHPKDNTRARKAQRRLTRPSYEDSDLFKTTIAFKSETPLTNGNGHTNGQENGLGATKRLTGTPHRTPVARRR